MKSTEVVLKKEWLITVKTPEMFLEKRMAGRGEIKRKILFFEN